VRLWTFSEINESYKAEYSKIVGLFDKNGKSMLTKKVQSA